jgi:hypothetical protein
METLNRSRPEWAADQDDEGLSFIGQWKSDAVITSDSYTQE